MPRNSNGIQAIAERLAKYSSPPLFFAWPDFLEELTEQPEHFLFSFLCVDFVHIDISNFDEISLKIGGFEY
jgi:hypothetical protein